MLVDADSIKARSQIYRRAWHCSSSSKVAGLCLKGFPPSVAYSMQGSSGGRGQTEGASWRGSQRDGRTGSSRTCQIAAVSSSAAAGAFALCSIASCEELI